MGIQFNFAKEPKFNLKQMMTEGSATSLDSCMRLFPLPPFLEWIPDLASILRTQLRLETATDGSKIANIASY